MNIWVIIHTNGSYTDETRTSYFKTEKEGMDEYSCLVSKDTLDYHKEQSTSYNVRLEKVTFGEDIVSEKIREFTYDDGTWFE
tara:strand:+ start:991 stop:1236 length:246 start_codon:yes stop_codon:yes gene_type:complete